MTIETNPNYWDCECDQNYIHAKAKTLVCDVCGATEDESPDSRINELNQKELGSAGINIELSDGVITVRHSESNDKLREWTAKKGDWDKLFDFIDLLRR